jgi:hypothetical protein
MSNAMLPAFMALLGLGAVLAVLYFFGGLSTGLRQAGAPRRRTARERLGRVRGLLLLGVVSLYAGVAFGRVVLVGLGVACLVLAYVLWRR